MKELFLYFRENEDSWDLHVRDALLEKCNKDGAKILHIHVDGKSVEVIHTCLVDLPI